MFEQNNFGFQKGNSVENESSEGENNFSKEFSLKLEELNGKFKGV